MSFYLTILHSPELTSESVRDHGQGPLFVFGINKDRDTRLTSANEGWVLYNPANPRNGARSLSTAGKNDWEEIFVAKVSNDAVKADLTVVFQVFDKPMCYQTLVQIVMREDERRFPDADSINAQFNGLGNLFVVSDGIFDQSLTDFDPSFIGPRNRSVENYIRLFEAIVKTCCEKHRSRYTNL